MEKPIREPKKKNNRKSWERKVIEKKKRKAEAKKQKEEMGLYVSEKLNKVERAKAMGVCPDGKLWYS